MKNFTKNRILSTALASLLICMQLSGCGSSDQTPAEIGTEAETAIASTSETAPLASTTTTTTTTSATTSVTTTAAVISTSETVTSETTGRNTAPPIRDISDTSPPFGDLSNAYICIYGLEVYPSVYVLTRDEVKELADYYNSLEWTEKSMDDYEPPTGSGGLVYYIYNNGKYSTFGDLSKVYYTDGVARSFSSNSKDGQTGSIFSAYDILFDGDKSRIVSTHAQELLKKDPNSV